MGPKRRHVKTDWIHVRRAKLQIHFAQEPYKRDDILQKRRIILRTCIPTDPSHMHTHKHKLPPSLSLTRIYTLCLSQGGWDEREGISKQNLGTCTHTNTLSPTLSLSHTLFSTLSLSLSLSHTLRVKEDGISEKAYPKKTFAHAHTQTHSLPLSLSLTHSFSRSLSLTHTHTHTLRVKEDGISEKRCQGRPFLVAKDETPFFI